MSVLLRQARGFEGYASALVEIDASHQAISQGVHDPLRHFSLDTAALSSSPNPGSHDDAVSGVDERLRSRAEGFERLRPFPEELPHTFVTGKRH